LRCHSYLDCAASHDTNPQPLAEIGEPENHGSPGCLTLFHHARTGAAHRPSIPSPTFIKEHHSALLISKQMLERAKGIELVRIKRKQPTQDLCFSSRPFVLCGLPVRRLRNEQLRYERRNGRFVLEIAGHPEFHVAVGQDRLVPIFLATLAVQHESQMIRFRTAAEMLESFGMHTGGKEYRRPVAAFERVFGATIFFDLGKASLVQRC
jgi:hypothetical protein